jgi:hypothetical protein
MYVRGYLQGSENGRVVTIATFADFHQSVYKTNRKRANPRFRIAAIYPSVNIQPLMKTPKIDIQQ